MDKEFEEELENYLKENGVKIIPGSNKEKLEILKAIVYNSRYDMDIAELKNNADKDKGITDDSYLDKVQNLELNLYNGLYYIINVKGIVKEEKKLKRRIKIKRFFGLK